MEEIDLKSLFELFWAKKIQIMIIVIIFAILGTIYSFFYVTPKYEAYTTILLVGDESAEKNVQIQGQVQTNTGITQSDITLNSKLVSTYSEIIKSKSVLRQVIDDLKLKNLKEDKLKNNVDVTSVKETEFLKISVQNEDSKLAAIIANKIAEVFSEKVVEIYNISNVNILDKAEAAEEPMNQNHIKDIIIFVLIGIVVSGAYVLIQNMLDTTIKSEKEIEEFIETTVLCSIPEYDLKWKKGERR